MHLTPSEAALKTLRLLSEMEASALSLPKNKLSARLGISESQLNSHVSELCAAEMIQKKIGRIGSPSSLVIISQSHEFSGISSESDSGEILMEQPMGSHVFSIGKTSREISTLDPMTTHGIGAQQKTPIPHPLKPPSKSNKQYDQLAFSLRSKGRADAAPSSEASQRRKLADGAEWSIFQTTISARNGKIPESIIEQLSKLRRRDAFRPWWNALLTGTVDRLKQQWAARRAIVTGQSLIGLRSRGPAKSSDTEKHESLWRNAANNIIDLGVSVERFLEVAEDVRPRAIAYPTLPFLASQMLKLTVTDWVPKDQRQAVSADGVEFSQIIRDSQQAMEKFRSSGTTPSMMVRSMPLTGNWPGLYGRQDNARGDGWKGIDLGGVITRTDMAADD